MTTELMPISGDIIPYNEFHGQVRQLKEENAKTIFDYEDPAGNKAARSHIHKLRQTKGAVEKTRKELKAEYLEKGRKVDGEAKYLVGELEEMIEAHAVPLREIEAREKARVDDLELKVNFLVRMGEPTSDLTAARLRLYQSELMEAPITEKIYAERLADAYAARDASYKRLGELADAAEKREEEQAELARLRKEKEERDRLDREREQKERDEKLTREAAERARIDAEAETQRKLEEGERQRQVEAEAAKKREEELERKAEDAEREARAKLEREAKAKADEEARLEANRKHAAKIHNYLIDRLGELGISEDSAKAMIKAVRDRKIHHLKIIY